MSTCVSCEGYLDERNQGDMSGHCHDCAPYGHPEDDDNVLGDGQDCARCGTDECHCDD